MDRDAQSLKRHGQRSFASETGRGFGVPLDVNRFTSVYTNTKIITNYCSTNDLLIHNNDGEVV